MICDWCVLEVTTLSDHRCIDVQYSGTARPSERRKGWQRKEPLLEHKTTQQR